MHYSTENMIYVDEEFPQGDVLFIPATESEIPQDASPVPREDGDLIVAHSESGHHHVVQQAGVELLTTSDPAVSFLVADVPAGGFHAGSFQGIGVYHLRDTHRHKPLALKAPPGKTVVWRIQRQRQGYGRLVED